MINVLTLAFRKYLDAEFEDFTTKLILAKGLMELTDAKPDDVEMIDFIENNTDANTYVSLYKLDRVINPTKGEFSSVKNSYRFICNKYNDEGEEVNIKLDDLEIQDRLCKAIRQVNNIVMRMMIGYKLERKIGGMDDDDAKGDDYDI